MSSEHLSLNDCLSSEPPNLNDLTNILLRFIRHPVAVYTDIEKAFLHVQLAEEDRDVTRFFWLSNQEDPTSLLITYRFNTVLFGATCSPFLLNVTLLKHLELNKENWVSGILHRDLYVDNILTRFTDEAEAITFFKDTRVLMSSASFNLRSWSSNSEQLRSKASNEDVLDEETPKKVLGMQTKTL